MLDITITKQEADAILEMAISRFESGYPLRREIKTLLSRIYDAADFYANGVNPEEFQQWLTE